MEIIHAGDTKRFANAETCVAYEYGTRDPDINIARVEVKGRYPIEGFAVNHAVKELVYVERGEGTIVIDGHTNKIGAGDVVFFDKEEKIAWEGELSLIISCTPSWHPNQHEVIL